MDFEAASGQDRSTIVFHGSSATKNLWILLIDLCEKRNIPQSFVDHEIIRDWKVSEESQNYSGFAGRSIQKFANIKALLLFVSR